MEDGALAAHVIGGGEPKGICGSGVVDAVACLLELELLDETGYLEDDPAVLCGAVSLTQKDVRMIQLAKSAVCAGMRTLAHHAGLRLSLIHISAARSRKQREEPRARGAVEAA